MKNLIKAQRNIYAFGTPSTGGPLGVLSVTGFNVDNTNPVNPVILPLQVDGTTITGTGALGSPLVAHFATPGLGAVLGVSNDALDLDIANLDNLQLNSITDQGANLTINIDDTFHINDTLSDLFFFLDNSSGSFGMGDLDVLYNGSWFTLDAPNGQAVLSLGNTNFITWDVMTQTSVLQGSLSIDTLQENTLAHGVAFNSFVGIATNPTMLFEIFDSANAANCVEVNPGTRYLFGTQAKDSIDITEGVQIDFFATGGAGHAILDNHGFSIPSGTISTQFGNLWDLQDMQGGLFALDPTQAVNVTINGTPVKLAVVT